MERSYGIDSFVLEEVDGEGAVTPRAGLISMAEAARGMGLPAVANREVKIKERERGFTSWEFMESGVVLIAGGGECVEDFSVLRADSASYEHELLNWLREVDEQTGRPRAIFAISAVMSLELRAAVAALTVWHRDPEDPCRSWAEVDFVPAAPSHKKGRKPDRDLAIRIEPRQKELFSDGSEVKYYAVVTNNFEDDGLEVLHWHRQKAGTIEHTNDVLKNDLATGVLPCSRFGANAAWLGLNVLTYNLLSVLRRTALPAEFERARPKRLRFHLFSIPAQLIRHARQTIARVVGALDELPVRLSAVRQALWQQTPIWDAAAAPCPALG